MGIILLGNTKVCKACGQHKPLSEFYKKSTSRDGYRHKCKDCWRIQTHEYRQQNRDKVKKWPSYGQGGGGKPYADLTERQREANRASGRRRYQIHRKKMLAYKKQYRRQHIDKLKRRDACYRKENPAIRKAQYGRRRAAEIDAVGEYTAEQWTRLINHYAPDGCCLACHEHAPMTIDHVIPLAKGGTNYPDNLQPLCLPCNMHKHTDTKDYRPDNGVFAQTL